MHIKIVAPMYVNMFELPIKFLIRNLVLNFQVVLISKNVLMIINLNFQGYKYLKVKI